MKDEEMLVAGFENVMRLRLRCVVAVVALGAGGALAAQAPDFPTKPVRFIVPFTPGAINDLLARLIGGRLAEHWNQQVVVDNRAGAGTVIGTDLVAKSPADGYTLLLVSTAFAINQTLYPKLPYDTVKDFAPVTQIASAPFLMVMYPQLR